MIYTYVFGVLHWILVSVINAFITVWLIDCGLYTGSLYHIYLYYDCQGKFTRKLFDWLKELDLGSYRDRPDINPYYFLTFNKAFTFVLSTSINYDMLWMQSICTYLFLHHLLSLKSVCIYMKMLACLSVHFDFLLSDNWLLSHNWQLAMSAKAKMGSLRVPVRALDHPLRSLSMICFISKRSLAVLVVFSIGFVMHGYEWPAMTCVGNLSIQYAIFIYHRVWTNCNPSSRH